LRWSDFPANKVVPQKVSFLSLFPSGEQGLFYFRKEYCYDEEITGKAMAGLTSF